MFVMRGLMFGLLSLLLYAQSYHPRDIGRQYFVSCFTCVLFMDPVWAFFFSFVSAVIITNDMTDESVSDDDEEAPAIQNSEQNVSI